MAAATPGEPAGAPPPGVEAAVFCHLDRLLEARSMTLTELSNRVGVSQANLSVLKNNRAKAIRYSTLIAICQALDCQPGDLFTVE